MDLSRQTSSRFTFDPATEGNPVWSPDGSRIVFSSNRSGPYDLYWKTSSGAGNEELLLKSEKSKFATDWSSDGRFILYTESGNLWALPLFGDQKPFPILQSDFNESEGRFTPDGHWIAYTSTESGIAQIYVQSFPPAGGKWMISINGGRSPRWRRDGRELFYYGLDNRLMAVPVNANGNNVEAGSPSPLFGVRVFSGGPTAGAAYAVTNNGQRFLVCVVAEEFSPSPAVVVQNWTTALKR